MFLHRVNSCKRGKEMDNVKFNLVDMDKMPLNPPLKLSVSANGEFQGYIKSVSKKQIITDKDKDKAKQYTTQRAIKRDIELIHTVTNGALYCTIVKR